jgi:hypothetical protein
LSVSATGALEGLCASTLLMTISLSEATSV